MNHYICIHSHCYQPPRENPWLEEIELQDSAYPYHDWNQRITAQCYGPNTASRILDNDQKIIDIVNNYTRTSFNFGPSLLSWLEKHDQEVYEQILKADKISQKKFNGHGSALAQCYNHMIMPLANSRDKRTQIIWGIKDFEFRFQRKPEGMWLPETAVDLETLDIMADYGIKFTILSPRQAKRWRKLGEETWQETKDAGLDPKISYLCKLPSGRDIAIFFYDGHISHDIAFGGLLTNGEIFTQRLLNAFSEETKPQLVHIATDGETYGHHHRYGEMALAYCLYLLEKNNKVKLTIYGEFLKFNPPMHQIEIHENSSWSCIHGIDRWRKNCGCCQGINPKWQQNWRADLREAFDWLRDQLIEIYENNMALYVAKPWDIRDEYISVILNRSWLTTKKFLDKHALKELNDQDYIIMLKLLEMQRFAMLMYTSCGWFFDEISGIETIQIMQYAARALQLAKEISGINLEEGLLDILEKAHSNIPEYSDGARLYVMFIKPAIIDITRVGAHYAVSSLFEDYPKSLNLYSFIALNKIYDRMESGKQKLAIGQTLIRSEITRQECLIDFAVVHLGDHNLIGGVAQNMNKEDFSAMQEEIKNAFDKSDISETIRLVEKFFFGRSYSLWHLFKDEQRKILDSILASTLNQVEISLRQLNQNHYPVIHAMKQMNIPLPRIFAMSVAIIINTDLLHDLNQHKIDVFHLKNLVEDSLRWNIELDKVTLSFIASRRIVELMDNFINNPENLDLLIQLEALLRILDPLSLNLKFWKLQNMYFFVGKKFHKIFDDKAKNGDETAIKWLYFFKSVGDYLKVKIN